MRYGVFLLCFASVVFSLCSAEVVLRVAGIGPTFPTIPAQAPHPETGVLDELTWPDLGRPGTEGLYKNVPYRVNAAGFRGPDVPAVPKPGTFRLALLGDSVTAAGGIPRSSSYAAEAEAALNDAGPGAYEVLNFGLPALNLTQIRELRLPIALRYNPELLIYGATVNDIEGPRYVEIPTERGRWGRDIRVLGLLEEAWRQLAPLGPVQWSSLPYNYFGGTGAFADFEAELAHLAATARSRRLCVLVLVHTQLSSLTRFHPAHAQYLAIEAAAQRQGMSVVQSLPRFLGMDPAELWLSTMDAHPNARGHALLAEALLEGMEALPASCWRGRRPAFDAATRSGGDR